MEETPDRREVDPTTRRNKYQEEVPYKARMYRCPHCMHLAIMTHSHMGKHTSEAHQDWAAFLFKRCGTSFLPSLSWTSTRGGDTPPPNMNETTPKK
jgi:hypothetical protein